MPDKWKEMLGTPDLKLGGFQLWIHSREFPEIEEYYDGNWLNVTAHCGASGADVWTSGNIIRTDEIASWASQTQRLYNTLSGKAELACLEPELSIVMKMEALGQIEMVVEITPNHLTQAHTFTFEIDQSHIPNFLKQCKTIAGNFPIKP